MIDSLLECMPLSTQFLALGPHGRLLEMQGSFQIIKEIVPSNNASYEQVRGNMNISVWTIRNWNQASAGGKDRIPNLNWGFPSL